MDMIDAKIDLVSSFLKGFSAVFSLGRRNFIEMPDFQTGFERDREAFAGDWQRIGQDMRNAVNQVVYEQR